MPPDVLGAVLDEARQCGILSFAHVHDHADAEALVSRGIGVLAHSVRDRAMDARLLDRMVATEVALVPPLFREEAEVFFSLEENPYMMDSFFLASERNLVPQLRASRFSGDPNTPQRKLDMSLENVARAHAAGVPIGLGTDSGFRLKPLGFAQHRELQLLSQAGLRAGDCLKGARDQSAPFRERFDADRHRRACLILRRHGQPTQRYSGDNEH